MAKRWLENEDKLLKSLFEEKKTVREIKEHFPERSVDAILSRKRIILPNTVNSVMWSEDRINYLKSNAKQKTVKELASHLNLSFATTIEKMKQLDIYEPTSSWKEWTDSENEYLIENYKLENNYTIARKLNRTSSSIQQQANKLNLKKHNPGVWTKEETEYLIENYSTKSLKELQRKIMRTSSSIYNKAYTLGLDNLNKEEKEKEIAFVIANALIMTDEEIALKLKCSVDKVSNIRKNNNIYKDNFSGKESFIEKEIDSLLKASDIEYQKQVKISDYIVDFFVPIFNLVIEVQGDYWHCNPKVYENGPEDLKQTTFILKDYNKKSKLLNLGYDIYYVWEYDILNNKLTVENNLKNLLNIILPSRQEIVDDYHCGIKRGTP